MDSKEVMRRLKDDGWYIVNIRGSHHQFKHPTNPGKVTLPHPKKDLPIGTVRNIFSQSGLEE
jgi:predicted RNA binding protein YcfA (HicA-like mRNA interferase family)